MNLFFALLLAGLGGTVGVKKKLASEFDELDGRLWLGLEQAFHFLLPICRPPKE